MFNRDSCTRQRGFAPKVRTGCVLCKQARVKCDEGTPSCKRCTRRKVECCYRIPKPWIFVPSDRTVCSKATDRHLPTQPDRISSSKVARTPGGIGPSSHFPPGTPPAADLLLPTPPLSTGSLEETEPPPAAATYPSLKPAISCYGTVQQTAALQYFLEVVAPPLAFDRLNLFCTITLPQIVWMQTGPPTPPLSRPRTRPVHGTNSYSTNAPRDDVCFYAALMESMIALVTLRCSLRGNSTASWTRYSPQFHYSRAVRMLALSAPPRHIVLLICVLLWFYEQINNDHNRANFHRESAIKLLAEWRSHEYGRDPTMDEYIASRIEPSILTGVKQTAAIRLCREVLGALKLQQPDADGDDNYRHCTLDEARASLDGCIGDFVGRRGPQSCYASSVSTISSDTNTISYSSSSSKNNDGLALAALRGLQMWNSQFEHYSGTNWVKDAPVLLSYATTVAMLVQTTGIVQGTDTNTNTNIIHKNNNINRRGTDWQRAFNFVLEEISKFESAAAAPGRNGHAALLDGVTFVAARGPST